MLSRLKFEIDSLVNEILDQLPQEVWTSSTTTFLDPAMGGGQFVRAIEQRLRSAGHSDMNISGRVYACENSKLSVQYAKNKYNLVATLGVGDFLEKDFGNMKFDVVVGNPPFQGSNGGGSILWADFANKACMLTSNKGYVAMITPNKWCGHTENVRAEKIQLYRDRFKNKLTHINVQECSRHFDKIGAYPDSFSYFVLSNAGSKQFTVQTLKDKNVVVGAIDFDFLPVQDFSKTTANILKKTTTVKKWDFKTTNIDKKHSNDHTLNIPTARFLHYKNRPVYLDFNSSVKPISKTQKTATAYIKATQQSVDSVFKSKLFEFWMYVFWNNDTLMCKFYNNLPYLDPEKVWTDGDIYKHFGLTKDEINFLENIIK